MDILEAIKVALEGLRQNKLRSFLTMLGIIIGISSVIAITTVGYAMSKTVSKAFDTVGNTSVQLEMVPANDQTSYQDYRYEDGFTLAMLEDLRQELPDVVKSYEFYGRTGRATVRDGKREIDVSLMGTTAGAMDVEKIKMIAGRFLTDQDVKQRKNICVIGDDVLEKVYGSDINRALGNEAKLYVNGNLEVYTIVGVYHFEHLDLGALGGGSKYSKFYLPCTVGPGSNKELHAQYGVLTLVSKDHMEQDCEKIKEFMTRKYYSKVSNWKVETQTVQSAVKEMTSAMGSIKIAISIIAGISLLVGGIGVMNILLVSVTERTREIGIRKALGATKNAIRKQFIIESIIICIIGGIIGIALGAVFGYLGAMALGMPSMPSLSSIMIAVGFSMVIGIFFGYYPANKAAKLDPIEALRYE